MEYTWKIKNYGLADISQVSISIIVRWLIP